MLVNQKQKKFLKSMAHSLSPLVLIGKDGVSENLYESIAVSLKAHELVKCSILKSCPQSVNEVAIECAMHTKSEVIQIIGRVIVLYKQSSEKKIKLP